MFYCKWATDNANILDLKVDSYSTRVDIAKKLNTARTIWGQSFDGTGNVSGHLFIDAKTNYQFNQNRATIVNITSTANPCDLYLGADNAAYWSITARNNADTTFGGKGLGFYDAVNTVYRMCITQSGDVGIGTTSPSQKLHVVGNIATYAPSTNDPTASIDLANTVHDRWQISGRFNKSSSSDNNKLITYYYNGTWNGLTALCTDGKFGIGTISPNYKLHVEGSSFIRHTSAGVLTLQRNGSYGVYVDYFPANQGNYGWRVGATEGGSFQFQYSSNTFSSVDTLLSIASNGKVGIGTTSPSDTLHINGGLVVAGNGSGIYLNKNSSELASLGFIYSSTDMWQISARFMQANAAENNRINLYHYNGSTWNKTVQVTTSGNMTVLGGITMYSDARKKTILNQVELSLKQIANAPLIEHYYNSDQEKTTHVGSIAQYWYGMNDWFCKEDSEGFLTMEIQNCALASAISIARELDRYETKTDKTIRKMKQRIAELEEEVERLKQN